MHAVRRGSQFIEMRDFDAARDRILMGQPRDSLVLSDLEKARVAYHEGGHAVLAYVLTHADPLLKVSIIPTGLALGVTQQLPTEERHIYPREYIEDALVVRMGGRVAEMLVYGDLSTGASDDLQRNTELARKMVREWGMSERVGPMAWGSQGMVFLGEDLMHTRRLLRGHRAGSSTKRSRGSCASRRPGPRPCCGSTGLVSRRSRTPCSSSRRSTGPRSAASSTSPTAGPCTAAPRVRRSSSPSATRPRCPEPPCRRQRSGLSSTGVPPREV